MEACRSAGVIDWLRPLRAFKRDTERRKKLTPKTVLTPNDVSVKCDLAGQSSSDCNVSKFMATTDRSTALFYKKVTRKGF